MAKEKPGPFRPGVSLLGILEVQYYCILCTRNHSAFRSEKSAVRVFGTGVARMAMNLDHILSRLSYAISGVRALIVPEK